MIFKTQNLPSFLVVLKSNRLLGHCLLAITTSQIKKVGFFCNSVTVLQIKHLGKTELVLPTQARVNCTSRHI